MGVWSWVECSLAIVGACSLLTYLVPYMLAAWVYGEQNLKRKYGAEWAVVTGASSGIGRALTEKLAAQGINVVMVALKDATFDKAHEQITAQFPEVSFKRVDADLSNGNPDAYMKPIVDATAGIQPSPNLIFNNAGFMLTSLFADAKLSSLIGNYNCNATSMVYITHHFLNRMLDAHQKGAVFFTSSPGGFMGSPAVSMYSSTKAWMTSLASSLSAELRPDGIDVLVVHPSPVNTGFYAGNVHGIDSAKMFQKTAGSPQNVASCYFRSIGRYNNSDQGYFPLVFRVILKVIDVTLFNQLATWFAAGMGDYKKVKQQRPLQRK
jgi:short-subunit dehydrogenase